MLWTPNVSEVYGAAMGSARGWAACAEVFVPPSVCVSVGHRGGAQLQRL